MLLYLLTIHKNVGEDDEEAEPQKVKFSAENRCDIILVTIMDGDMLQSAVQVWKGA